MLKRLLSILLLMSTAAAFTQTASASSSMAFTPGSVTGTVHHVSIDINGVATAYTIRDAYLNETHIEILEANRNPTTTADLKRWHERDPQDIITALYTTAGSPPVNTHAGFELDEE